MPPAYRSTLAPPRSARALRLEFKRNAVLFPGRFTAPLVAIVVLVLFQTGFHQALGVAPSSGTYALLSPANGPPVVDTGVYYHVAPDLPIVQVMFMAGIAVAVAAGRSRRCTRRPATSRSLPPRTARPCRVSRYASTQRSAST